MKAEISLGPMPGDTSIVVDGKELKNCVGAVTVPSLDPPDSAGAEHSGAGRAEAQVSLAPAHILSDPALWATDTPPPGPVDIYWEFQAGRPAHKFSQAIRCF